MTAAEQDIRLLLRLYLLSRFDSYINYFSGFNFLHDWILNNDNDTNQQPNNLPLSDSNIRTPQLPSYTYKNISAPIMCGNCFTFIGRTNGGCITLSCSHCANWSNLPYEIQHICRKCSIPLDYCIYLLCSIVEDIYKWNSDVRVQVRIADIRW